MKEEIVLLTIEEYIAKRKAEDQINEFDSQKLQENTRIIVNYVFEYFNQYLDIDRMYEKTVNETDRIVKYRQQLKEYSKDIQDWFVRIYEDYDKQLHRSIINFVKKQERFLLYHTEHEFRSCSYDCYSELIQKHPYLKGEHDRLFQFLHQYHAQVSQPRKYEKELYITEEINQWIEETYKKHGVNIYRFISEYLSFFSEHHERWPSRYKRKEGQFFEYDYKHKNNLFNINELYIKISDRPFMKRKKQSLETLMMYEWVHSIAGDEGDWEEYIKSHQ